MKKVALVLALSALFPMVNVAVSHAAANGSDLAIGDPQGGNYHRTARKHHTAKPATTTDAAAAKETPKAPPAEKPAEPAK
ncbi:MAG: hypothetical protein K8R69_10350 [Deltaproteobacteria bacterium]|nr:hypothetical protein [Deltaproteobacteria bacterium]